MSRPRPEPGTKAADVATDLRARLATTVKARRLALNKTQQQIADKAEVHLRTVQRIEGDDTWNPGIDVLTRLAYALGLDPSKLFGSKRGR